MSPDKQVSNPSAFQPQPAYEDEISLLDIFSVLFRRKKFIIGITTFVVCIGLIYAFTTQRVYQVETVLSPPSNEIIQSFNLQNLQKINENDIYSRFTQIITTRTFRQEFFSKFKLIERLSDMPENKMTISEINNVFEGFSGSLKVIKKDKKDKKDNIEISLEGVNEDILGALLDDFVIFADSRIINQTVNDMQADSDYKIKKIKREIKQKRFFYNQRRKDELESLNEDFQIAKKLGIIERNDARDLVSSDKGLSISLNRTKRYMEGTKVLQAEISSIKNRKSDDIHIAGLRGLQEQLIKLEAIEIEKGKLQAVTVDKKASVNVEPIRPKRTLIVILSLILGGMLGIFAAFILEFISKLKK